MTGKVGQTEMFEAPPTRRVIVPEGRGAWWGVDPSSLRCAIATIAADGLKGVELASFPNVDGPLRLSLIYAETRKLAATIAGLVAPGIVLIEQPSGKFQNLELVYAVGATMAGVYDGVLAACGSPARFESKTSQWWKKRSFGRGDVYKPNKKTLGRAPVPEDYAGLTWAWNAGMPRAINSWDAADAWGMAEAMRRDVALEQR